PFQDSFSVVSVLSVWTVSSQHLNKHPAELLGGYVVQQWVNCRAEVIESVGDGLHDQVGSVVLLRPLGLGVSDCHQTPGLKWDPTDGQSTNNTPCGESTCNSKDSRFTQYTVK
uniref:Uncharacterized protein n=1 Tax=Callorhinchus milii TaxID=7868 RepID=A0A4W3J3M0_CALMI